MRQTTTDATRITRLSDQGVGVGGYGRPLSEERDAVVLDLLVQRLDVDPEQAGRPHLLPPGVRLHPGDVDALVAFLISEETGFITGQNFVVDGGMTKKMIYVE